MVFVMRIRLITTLVLVMAVLGSCTDPRIGDSVDDTFVTELISQASADVESQHFDSAMEKAIQALRMAEQADNQLQRVKALCCITGIDIMTSRDSAAWESAIRAEGIARKEGFREDLAGILISKAKLCSYAEISPETGRNDEGLGYANEALAIAEELSDAEKQAEACYVIGSLYINKNRWNDQIDTALYNTAGRYLDKGQAIADTYDIPRLKRNGIMFRSRWFQQGDRNEEAVGYFTQVLATLKDSDHLTASSLYDRLVRLYTRLGDSQKALDCHDLYVRHLQQYIIQKNDDILQETQTKFEVEKKERAIEIGRYRTAILVLAVILALGALAAAFRKIKTVRKRNTALARSNSINEQIISFLSSSLRSPDNKFSSEFETLSSQAASMTESQIREKCSEIAAKTDLLNDEITKYIGDLLIERRNRIAETGLSQREIEIIRLSAQGFKASEIAEKLFLSVHTVNTHRQRIYSKMEVRNISEMLSKSKSLGII